MQIPYEGSFLPAYFFRAGADQAPRATVILTNGYDGTAEELYFTNGAAALERGYNVLAFDGPGQGAMIIDHGIPFRPDWEKRHHSRWSTTCRPGRMSTRSGSR